MTEIKITLPIPPRSLSPNGRVHWAAKARAVKQARYDGGLAARNALGDNPKPLWKRAVTQAIFYVRTKHARDGDNYLAMLKPTFDSFADAGIVQNDWGFEHQPVRFEVDTADPRVEIVIQEVKSQADRGRDEVRGTRMEFCNSVKHRDADPK